MTIDGVHYSSDVLVTPEGVQSDWWRVEVHLLSPCDLHDTLSRSPSLLVIGTGYDGMMGVPEATLAFLAQRRIEYEVHPTPQACLSYSQQRSLRRTFALLHVT